MHSSRMRTPRLLIVSRSIPLGDTPPQTPASHVTCGACWEATPPCREQNDRQV